MCLSALSLPVVPPQEACRVLLNSPNRQGTASRYHGKDISISPFVYKIDNGWEARSHPSAPLPFA